MHFLLLTDGRNAELIHVCCVVTDNFVVQIEQSDSRVSV